MPHLPSCVRVKRCLGVDEEKEPTRTPIRRLAFPGKAKQEQDAALTALHLNLNGRRGALTPDVAGDYSGREARCLPHRG